jgi:hypothetical protein
MDTTRDDGDKEEEEEEEEDEDDREGTGACFAYVQKTSPARSS